MALVFGTAVGLSVLRAENANWNDGLLAAVATWFVLGLINQARDLWPAYRRQRDLSTEQRWGWCFALFWRVAVACILVGYYMVTQLIAGRIISLPEAPGNQYLQVGHSLRNAVYFLSFIIVLDSIRRPAPPRPASFWSRSIDVLGVCTAIVWAIYFWFEIWVIPALVFIAVIGIEISFPLCFAREEIREGIVAVAQPFLWSSWLAVGFLTLSIVLAFQFARQWKHGRRRRLILAGLLIVGLGITASYPTWVYCWELHRLSPPMAEGLLTGPLHRWFSALLLVLVFVTALTWRIVRSDAEPADDRGSDWRRSPAGYYHERRDVLGLLVLSFVVRVVPFEGISLFLFDPFPLLLPTAVLLLGVQCIWQSWSRSKEPRPASPPPLEVSRFFAVWIALLATTLVALPTIAWIGFAVWFAPWFRLPWQ